MASRASPVLPPSSTLQPNAEEYAVFLNRFKLLNLVQRVAHNDVMELVETVGLDALTYKGTRLPRALMDEQDSPHRGNVERTAARTSHRLHTSDRLSRTTNTRRRTSPGVRRGASGRAREENSGGYQPRRTNQDLRAAAAADALRDDVSEGTERGRVPSTRRRHASGKNKGYGFRSREEREAYYRHLATPRQAMDWEEGEELHGEEEPMDRAAYEGAPPSRHRDDGYLASGRPPTGQGQRHRGPSAEEEERQLFSEFLRARYGAEASVDDAESRGRVAPWRQLDPYNPAAFPRNGIMDGHPPSGTWPPGNMGGHTKGDPSSLAAFYRAGQPAGENPFGHHEGLDVLYPGQLYPGQNNNNNSDSNLDGPPPAFTPSTAPRYGGGEGHPSDMRTAQPAYEASMPSTRMDARGSSGAPSPAATLATQVSPAFTSESQQTQYPPQQGGQSQAGSYAPASWEKRGDTRGSANANGVLASPQDEGDSISAMFKGNVFQPAQEGHSQPLASGRAAGSPMGNDASPMPREPTTPTERAQHTASAPSPSETPPRGGAPNLNVNSLSFPSQAHVSSTSAASGGGGGGGGMGASRVILGGRSLGAKAKPKGAAEPSHVPFSAIQQAAAVLAKQQAHRGAPSPRSPSGQVPPPLPSPNSRSRSVYFAASANDAIGAVEAAQDAPAAAHSGPVLRQGRGWNVPSPHGAAAGSSQVPPPSPQAANAGATEYNQHASHPSTPQQREEPPKVQPNLAAMAAAIDRMLRDHQRVMEGVVHGSGERRSRSDAQTGERASSSASSGGTPSGDWPHGGSSSGDSNVDEMLLFSRMQRAVNAMEGDIARIQSSAAKSAAQRRLQHTGDTETESSAEYAEDRRDESTTEAKRQPTVGPPTQSSLAPASALKAPRPERGAVPEAVVRRLLSYQVEQNQCIAYNEKLWNTSNVSQFAFAQRLTNAVFEDCLEEVTHEVDGIMDEYVDGLADHELQ